MNALRPSLMTALAASAVFVLIFAGLNTPASAKSHKHHTESASQSSPTSHHHHSSSNQTASSDQHPKSRHHHVDQTASNEHKKRHKVQQVASGTESRHELHIERLAHLHRLHQQEAAEQRQTHLTAHQRRLAKIAYRQHLARLYSKEAYQDHLARLASREQHEQRLAAENAAHKARLHAIQVAELAHEEALRDQHHDTKSHILNSASSSGLPIWQGDAYAAQVPVKIVQVDLNDPRIKVSAIISRDGIGTAEPFMHMVSRAHPNVAVTGTFFSLDNLRPVGDIVINGSLAYFGGMGTALAITPGNHADMIRLPWGHHHDWTGYETVIACGPRLLQDGAIVLDPAMEHYTERAMLAPNSRIAVGITKTNQLVFCMTREPIYLGRLAKIMLSLGCKQAMNLDAGTSTGMYCNGRVLATPGRWLTNAIVVYANKKPQDQAETRLPKKKHSPEVHLADVPETDLKSVQVNKPALPTEDD